MPSPITFSDDEDSVRFSRQLQALDISQLMKPSVLNANEEMRKKNSEEKENVPWRVNSRVKDEVGSPRADSYVFVASPDKQVKVEIPDVPEMDENIENIIKQEPLDEDDVVEQKPQPHEWWGVNRGRGIVLERLSARQELATPDRGVKEEDEERDEWDVEVKMTPIAKTPRSAAATTKRRRILRQIKTEMAEKANTWVRDVDPDFVYVGQEDEEEKEATPTSLRLRSSRRNSRISYRNLDWSTEANDRKRNRHAALLVDESEEEREAERERDRQERREKVAKKRRWTKERIASIPSITVPSDDVFSISDDEPLSEIARSMRKEDEGDEDYKAPRRRRKKMKLTIENSDDDTLATISSRLKKEEEEKRKNELAIPNSDDDSLETIAWRLKKEEEKKRKNELTIENSDDDTLSTIAWRLKKEEEERKGEKRTSKIEIENEEEEEGEYTIKRRRRPLVNRSSGIQ